MSKAPWAKHWQIIPLLCKLLYGHAQAQLMRTSMASTTIKPREPRAWQKGTKRRICRTCRTWPPITTRSLVKSLPHPGFPAWSPRCSRPPGRSGDWTLLRPKPFPRLCHHITRYADPGTAHCESACHSPCSSEARWCAAHYPVHSTTCESIVFVGSSCRHGAWLSESTGLELSPASFFRSSS